MVVRIKALHVYEVTWVNLKYMILSIRKILNRNIKHDVIFCKLNIQKNTHSARTCGENIDTSNISEWLPVGRWNRNEA